MHRLISDTVLLNTWQRMSIRSLSCLLPENSRNCCAAVQHQRQFNSSPRRVAERQGPASPKAPSKVKPPTPGDLAKSSVFAGEEEFESVAADGIQDPSQYKSKLVVKGAPRKDILKAAGLYPREATFLRAERLRMIKRRGRLTKAQVIDRAEKSHLSKSHFIKTSVKKLGPLARQIAGKSLTHAMVQMRFSPKKAAKSVLSQLKLAQQEASVTKRFNPKETFIQQAWVGRGTPTYGMDYRAHGRGYRLTQPYTSISLVLKENQTKERVKREKAERLARRGVWTQLASRPIYGQHQYYTW